MTLRKAISELLNGSVFSRCNHSIHYRDGQFVETTEWWCERRSMKEACVLLRTWGVAEAK